MRKLHPLWLAVVSAGLMVNPASSAINTRIAVTTSIDENGENLSACSLREAIKSNNDMIPFGGCGIGDRYLQNTIELEDKTYVLDPALGELSVTRNVKIRGKITDELDKIDPLSHLKPKRNPPVTTIDAQEKSRLFNSTVGSPHLLLENLLLVNGGYTELARGGAILAGGVVSLGNVILRNNKAISGGAVYISGMNSTMDATTTTFEANQADIGAAVAMSCIDNLHYTDRGMEITQSAFIANGDATSQSVLEGCGHLGLNMTTTTLSGNEVGATASKPGVIRMVDQLAPQTSISLNYVTAAENKGGPVLGYGALGNLGVTASIIAFNPGGGCQDYDTTFDTSLQGEANTFEKCPFTVPRITTIDHLDAVVPVVTLADELNPLDFYGSVTKNYLPVSQSKYVLDKGPGTSSCPDGVDQRGAIRTPQLVCDRGAVERKQLVAIKDDGGKNKENSDRLAFIAVLANDFAPETTTARDLFTDDFIDNYDIVVSAGNPCVKGDPKLISETHKEPYMLYDSKGKLSPIGGDVKCNYRIIKYKAGTKEIESTSNEAQVSIQITNFTPNAKDDHVYLQQGASAVSLNVLNNDDDKGDGKFGGFYCGRPTGNTDALGLPVEDCSVVPGLNIRIMETPKIGRLTAEYKGPCPDNSASVSQTCYGGTITYHPFNTLSPFSDSFTYIVLDKDLGVSNAANVVIENTAAPEGSTGGSLGWLSLGVLGMMALRRHRRQVKA